MRTTRLKRLGKALMAAALVFLFLAIWWRPEQWVQFGLTSLILFLASAWCMGTASEQEEQE